MNKYITSVILAIIIGTLSGIEGRACNLEMLTGLLLFGVAKTHRQAAGLTLLFNIGTIAAGYEYYRKGDVDIKVLGILIVFSVVFSYIGALLNYNISPKIINYLIATTSFLASMYFFNRAYYN